MANLYGVSNPNPLPQSLATIGGTNVSCSAGVETNFISGTPSLPTSPGWYYPFVTGWVTVSSGATAPTQLTFALRINGGSDLVPWTIYNTSLPANAYVVFPLTFHGYNLITSNPSGVYNFQVSATPTAQLVVITNPGTIVYAQWLRAPDQ